MIWSKKKSDIPAIQYELSNADIVEYARMLKANPFFNQLFVVMENDAIQAWKNSSATSLEDRESYYLFIKVLGTIKGRIEYAIGEALGVSSQKQNEDEESE